MPRQIVECVPNFSEGRDRAVVDRIVDAVAGVRGVAVLDRTMDADHNRSVVTFAGSPQAVCEAAVRAIAEAVRSIDLNRHSGVHPRVGAADVIPFVPIEGATLEDCARLAVETAEEIWQMLRVPSYLYEAAARKPERARLENVRRGEFEGLRESVRVSEEDRPDIGGPELHPTAGACIIGARKFLLAYNINLETGDIAVAREIARKIRASSGGFPHVKALGLMLRSRGQAQVSMNLTDFEKTSLFTVFEAVRSLAGTLGTSVASSEIIGLMPRAALDNSLEAYFRFENFSRSVVLEERIAEALPSESDALLDTLADSSGDRSAIDAAVLATKAIRVCKLSGLDDAVYREDREFFKARLGETSGVAARRELMELRLRETRQVCLPHLREELDLE